MLGSCQGSAGAPSLGAHRCGMGPQVRPVWSLTQGTTRPHLRGATHFRLRAVYGGAGCLPVSGFSEWEVEDGKAFRK